MEQALDAAAVRDWFRAGLTCLSQARQEIDAINVYPVADGDTGSNLCSTLLAVVRELDRDAESPPDDLAGTLKIITHAALLGARGNSGVILSQMLRGLADALVEGAPDGQALARGLTRAADLGYRAVGEPVEGTVLTVARASARAATEVADAGGALADVAQAAADGARTALARTPQQLRVLKTAGVVDAGGRGLLVLIEALVGVLRGQAVAGCPSGSSADRSASSDLTDFTGPERLGPALAGMPAPDGESGSAALGPVRGGDGGEPAYEVMYLLDATDEQVTGLRGELGSMGNSLVVVGGEGLWNIHVHVDDPGEAVEAGIRAGRPHRVRITHLEGAAHVPGRQARHVVAVAPGVGLAEVLRSAGATVVTSGGTDSEGLLDAIQGACAAEVVVLPDDERSRSAAESAASSARSAGVRVAVLPTRAPVQVMAALAVHDPERDFDADVVAMTAAARSTRHGEVELAAGEAVTSAGVCRPGDVLGLVEGDVVVIGPTMAQVGRQVVDRLLSGGGELVTLVSGRHADAGLTDDLRGHLHETRPDVDTVTYDGGQEQYPLLVGVE